MLDSFVGRTSFLENEDEILNGAIFRPIHYLGSKFRMLDFIDDTINDICSDGRVCDLFAGSGSVSYKLSQTRAVTSVDIQHYSKIICHAIFTPNRNIELISAFMEKYRNDVHKNKMLWAAEPMIMYELECISSAKLGRLDPLCELLEKGAIVTHQNGLVQNCSLSLTDAISETLKRMADIGCLNNSNMLCYRHFGGLYYSYSQSIQLDIFLENIHGIKDPLVKNSFLASLLSTASSCVNTVGRQFAQPLRPRNSKGEPKPGLLSHIQKDRFTSISEELEKWLYRYTTIKQTNFNHTVIRDDYFSALQKLPLDTKVVYADPPYTRDHYSRFYHVLETICLRDNPKISLSLSKGKVDYSRGLYREDRHQSPFCIKTKAAKEFERMFSKIKQKDVALVLSYSPFDETQKTHPRLLTMSKLLEIAGNFYDNVEVKTPGVFVHSKLNHSSKHLSASQNAEVLIVCK